MAKRKAGAFAKRVGAGIKRGLTFKQAVQAAKGSNQSGKVKIGRIRRVRQRITLPRRTRRFRRRRGTMRRFRRPGITPWRIIKAAAIFGPPAASAIVSYQGAGGGVTGITRGVVPALTTAYTGYNTNDGKFYPANLVVGWSGPIAVAILSKAGLGKLFKV